MPASALPPRQRFASDPERQARLEALRRRIEQLQARHRRTMDRCRTGLPELDAALDGGLPRGAVHELIAASSAAGAGMLALHLALAAARTDPDPPPAPPAGAGPGRHRPILWLDPQQTFYPPAAEALGIDLDRLLVARGLSGADALWLSEQALRCPALAAVVLPMRTIDPRALRRLQLAAESGTGLGLLVLERPAGHAFAASRLIIEPLPARDEPDEALVWTQRLRVRVERLRGGAAGRTVELLLPLTAAGLCPRPAVGTSHRLSRTA